MYSQSGRAGGHTRRGGGYGPLLAAELALDAHRAHERAAGGGADDADVAENGGRKEANEQEEEAKDNSHCIVAIIATLYDVFLTLYC